jgi:osmotically-inducible protein OsmY
VYRIEQSRRAFLASLPLLGGAARAAEPEVTDDALYDQVNRQLITDRDLGAHPLEVKVQEGVVTVTGFVESEKHQKRVDKLVKKVKGVKEVVNKTQIRAGL